MSKTARAEKLIHAQEWLHRELAFYMRVERVNGAPLTDDQRESYSALKTAFECVTKELDEMEMEVK